MPLPEAINRLRRRAAQFGDQLLVLTRLAMRTGVPTERFDGVCRFALLTVNFHSTYYLKLMLLSLAEQQDPAMLKRIVRWCNVLSVISPDVQKS